MKKLVLTFAAVVAFTAPAFTQDCKPQITDDKIERPLLVAGGGDKGNGGFVFSRTSGKLLELAQNSLMAEINVLVQKRSELVYKSERCQMPIDLRQLKVKIANVDSDYENRATPAINPEGKREERFFHINKCGNVEAARLYFEVFVPEYFKYQEAKTDVEKDFTLNRVRNPIIHEALHDFGYNEMESRECSADINSVLESYSETKLKRLQEGTLRKNIQAIKGFLASSKCLDESSFLDVKSSMQAARWHGGSSVIMMVGHQILICIAEKTTLKKENPQQNSGYLIRAFGNVIYNVKTLDEVAAWLNSVFKFDFEQAIPTEK